MRKPDPSLVAKLLSYNPTTGALIWKPRERAWFNNERTHGQWNRRFAWKPALASKVKGGIGGEVLGQPLLAHDVAWCLHFGVWPTHTIEHLDGDRTNNKMDNLSDPPTHQPTGTNT